MPAPRPKRSRTNSSMSSRGSRHENRTEITINVYDLLPPGRLSSILWSLGGSLLHSGVVIGDREYAYGGHNRRGITGVYYTRPKFEPPGGTFRTSILQGITFRSASEIEEIVRRVSEEFLGERYNLLTNNCNHFTSALCERLTGKPAPGWVNRAASIGLALPCMVPKEWISPPDFETADGELLNEETEGEEDYGEAAAMLERDRKRQAREEERRRRGVRAYSTNGSVDSAGGGGGDGIQEEEEEEEEERVGSGSSLTGGRRLRGELGTPPPRLVSMRDTSGREIPVAERAPVPGRR